MTKSQKTSLPKKILVSPQERDRDEASAPEKKIDSKIKHFQAIGTIQATVERDETGFFFYIGERRYHLYIPRSRIKAWFKQLESSPNTSLFLRVYPKCQIVPKQEPEIRFQVIAWSSENYDSEQSGEFILKGVWQFLPQIKTPCISVYRNENGIDPTEKFKATHLPVIMRREEEEIRPFRFNPKLPKEQLPKRYFIEGKFRFIPSKNCFGWVEDLAVPSERLPRYKKPIKVLVQNNSLRKS